MPEKSPSGTVPANDFTTTLASKRPIKRRKSPMPTAIARFKLSGIASRIALRNPVSTKIVMKMPSQTITAIASDQVSPSPRINWNATTAFSPIPAARANG